MTKNAFITGTESAIFRRLNLYKNPCFFFHPHPSAFGSVVFIDESMTDNSARYIFRNGLVSEPGRVLNKEGQNTSISGDLTSLWNKVGMGMGMGMEIKMWKDMVT
ncbi:hypothetical protein LOAG_07521 [Loa loa]|uniref:Uncharacterized protein n=1 Tax=Loa loa TaxID=7209 RepID=A0A1S0TWC6_LOALO|nr:hypothetical protein LOAG_07521 [Loa loa]EFO20962.1 hypothetical protein LOAG_07521 [Loa loa]